MLHVDFRSLQSRHPLARLVAGAIALVAVLLLITLGTFALIALVIGGAGFAVRNALAAASTSRTRPSSPAPQGVIEGEFEVVVDPRRPLRDDLRR